MDAHLHARLAAEGPAGLAVTGEIDAANAERFRNVIMALAPPGGGELEVDLTGLEFIDSTGLGALVGASKALEPAGVTLVLAHPAPNIARLIDLVNLRKVIEVRP